MKVVFVGAGNVASSLASQLATHSFHIIQVYSRTIESAKQLGDKLNTKYTSNIKELFTDADLYIYSVKDTVLEQVIKESPTHQGISVHTAGSMPLDIFHSYSSKYGVIYPFQTFTKGRNLDWNNVPIFIEASDKEVESTLISITKQLSNKITTLPSEQRKYLHLAGVFACNFVNHMYTISEQILNKANLPFEVTVPLIDETCDKIHTLAPINAQTGPAIRYDENVINKHLELIEENRLKDIYRLISENIYETNKNLNKNE